jgi:rRNA maturation endonuclease Nob1
MGVNMEMLYKCDICKKIIKDKDEKVFAGYRWGPEHIFCSKCGKPINDFLKRHKFERKD